MSKVLRKLSGLLLLVASFTLAFLVIRYQPHVEHIIRSLGPLAYPLAIIVFAIVASAPFSVTDALAVMNGAIFGPWQGALINAVGLVFAAMIGYWVNSHAAKMMDLESYLERLPGWVKRFPVGSPAFLISVRVIPGFGGTVATATAATFKIPMWVHVWTMCAIAVPICTVLAIFGDRVTIAVHTYEERAHQYWETHRPHFTHHHSPSPEPRRTP